MEKENYASDGKRPGPIHWYYNQGIHELLEIWKNFLLFVWQHYSVRELSSTLLYPWRRDVVVADWRGWHPGKMLELFLENLISRIIGLVVRTVVIFAGLIGIIFILFAGLVAVFLWISGPLLFFIFFVYAFRVSFYLPYVGGLFLFWIVVTYICYRRDTKLEMLKMDYDAFLDHHVFERICGRLGISRKRFPEEILASQEPMDEFLKARNMDRKDYLRIVRWELERQQEKADSKKFWQWNYLKKIAPVGAHWRYGFTVNLDRYCQDLSQYDASEYSGAKLVGRSEEYEVLKLVLQRPDQNCALVVAASGVGKKTLIHELARKIRFREEGGYLSDMRMLILDLGRVISDAVNRGEDIENSLRRIFYEAAYAGNVILVIENIEHFIGKDTGAYHPDVSAVLSEFLHLPSFQVIATSTMKEYHKLIEREEQIVKYFEVIEMREPSEDETIDILLSQLGKYEPGRVLFSFPALKTIVRDSASHNWDVPLPERAIDMAMGTLMFWEKKSDEQFISEKTVLDYLSLKTGVKHGEIEGDERKKLLNLETILHRQIVGQQEAINQVSEALRRSRSGIGNSEKPVGSFLFLGPTGVGKTETAKALAKTYFGDESRMIRLDMSEFQTPNSIDRLLGSSQLNQPGRLVTQIKDNPYSLLLLDELEKAYPEVLDIFLQILDEGFVTDAFGEKINFRNTMIIATSNVGAAIIKNMVQQGSQAEEIKQAVIDYAIENNIFRTEFLNRFEGVIFFRPLNEKELGSVVRLQLQKFARKLAKEKNIEIVFGDEVVEKIISKGYNPIFGARSLNRYIEEAVEGIVAKKLISGEVSRGEKMTLSL